ncbi:trigger factor [Nocardioides pocheonensis]|uniref:Trigger factor n=1 Tax=Nocardioides pocheonensis TaxID=661485 RepID=A0A3N0GNN8_9ACTN|nr:trigger factor [Nocardioides pocheonensis]RNM13762.1 trigger factor [Nocardioides pocheonensis]
MKSAVETLNPTRAKLTVEVEFAELKPSLDAAYQRIAKQVNIPGFRKGKVPPPVIDRQVGRGVVLDEAINEALPKLYVQALEENDLQPLAQPEIDITRFEDNSTLEFTAEVDVRPTIDVPAYDDLTIQVDDIVVTDDEVEEQVQNLRERFATLKDVERPVQDGDVVTIDLVASKGGETVEGGEVNGYSYKVGSGQLIDGVDEALTGLSVGEEKTFQSQLLGGEAAGEDVDVLVKVSSVKEQELPEFDDDFAQTASEFDTAEELREDVRTRLERGKRLEQAAAARDAVLEKLLDSAEIPLPEATVGAEIAGRRQEIEQQLMYAGLTMEQYLDNEKQTVDEFEADLEKRVRDAMAAQFLLDEVAKKEQIGVDQAELSQHLMRRAQQSGQNPDDFVKHMVEHNHIPEMVSEVVRGKALAMIVEGATVTDASGNHVELKNLRPDGTIGEPEAQADDAAEAADEGSEKDSAGE